jgi:hypothetical protein
VITGIADNSTAAPQFSVFSNSSSNILVKGNSLTNNNELQVDLFDIDGKIISGQKVVPAANSFETNLNTTNLAKGTYLVRIGNSSFQKVYKIALN